MATVLSPRTGAGPGEGTHSLVFKCLYRLAPCCQSRVRPRGRSLVPVPCDQARLPPIPSPVLRIPRSTITPQKEEKKESFAHPCCWAWGGGPAVLTQSHLPSLIVAQKGTAGDLDLAALMGQALGGQGETERSKLQQGMLAQA